MLLEDYLAQNDICVLSRPLPLSVRGFVFRRGMGYCIVLNDRYCEHSQRRTLRHELLASPARGRFQRTACRPAGKPAPLYARTTLTAAKISLRFSFFAAPHNRAAHTLLREGFDGRLSCMRICNM